MTAQFSSFFVRPPRQTYYDHDLGPQLFKIDHTRSGKPNMGIRSDFQIFNNRNLKINTSFYQSQNKVT